MLMVIIGVKQKSGGNLAEGNTHHEPGLEKAGLFRLTINAKAILKRRNNCWAEQLGTCQCCMLCFCVFAMIRRNVPLVAVKVITWRRLDHV